MQTYYGTKKVQAEPREHTNGEQGYAVSYEDGYESWSPKHIFESFYFPTTQMPFTGALAALKTGKRVARQGWNGKGMWISLVSGSVLTVSEGRPLASVLPVGTEVAYQPHIDMYTAQGQMVPWVASQSDLLAGDWTIVE